MEENQTGISHTLTLKKRSSGTMTGVQDVKSFDETEILLVTCAGRLVIKGEKLQVKALDLGKGEVEIEGRVDSLTYLSKNVEKGGQSILKRMFG